MIHRFQEALQDLSCLRPPPFTLTIFLIGGVLSIGADLVEEGHIPIDLPEDWMLGWDALYQARNGTIPVRLKMRD